MTKNKDQQELRDQLIEEIQDLSASNASDLLTDFTLYALSFPGVAENIKPGAIAKIYRLRRLIEDAKQLE